MPDATGHFPTADPDVGQFLIKVKGDAGDGDGWRELRSRRTRQVVELLQQIEAGGEPVRYRAFDRTGQVAIETTHHVIEGLRDREEVSWITSDEPTDVL